MALRLWSRLPAAAHTVAELRADIRQLTATIQRLEEIQRKDAQQIKRLRQAVEDSTAASHKAADAVRASATEFHRLVQQHGDVERQQMFERMDERQRIDSKWRKIFNNQLSALLRHVALPLDQLHPPHALNARRFRLRSQNEEDGVLFALLNRAGWGTRRFVEIGSGKSGGTAAGLAHECGWAGMMIEVSAKSVGGARKKFAGNRLVTVIEAEVTPGNVNGLLEQHGYQGEVDVLSIDIDSYDYWVFNALSVTSPRILVLEYNALFGPERRVTVPLDQPLSSAPKGYCGASLAALTDLAARKGYRLVTCENAGVNAFFLREDVAPDVPAVTAVEAFKPLRSRTELDDVEVKTDIYAAIGKRNLPLVDV
jgi:hypothetical protein